MSLTIQFADLALRSKKASGSYKDASAMGIPMEFSNFFPVPIAWPADGIDGIPAVLNVLPSNRREIASLMEGFRYGAVGFTFPYNPGLSTVPDYEHLLDNLQETLHLQVDKLALLFALLASGVFYGSYHRMGEFGRPERCKKRSKGPTSSVSAYVSTINKTEISDEVTVTAALQALRSSCFLVRPTLTAIEAMVLILQYLADTGRFVEGWSWLGLTVRLAFWMNRELETNRKGHCSNIQSASEDYLDDSWQ